MKSSDCHKTGFPKRNISRVCLGQSGSYSLETTKAVYIFSFIRLYCFRVAAA